VPSAAFAYPPPDDGHPIVIDGGRWDGSGFRSTGLLVSLAPVQVTVKQTFTKAGSYPYGCLLHPSMQGEVHVG
jgi:plastocyanin